MLQKGGVMSTPESSQMDSHFVTNCGPKRVNFQGSRVFEDVLWTVVMDSCDCDGTWRCFVGEDV